MNSPISASATGKDATGAGVERLIDAAVAEVSRVVLGKEIQVRMALCCLFARGHLLIEDLPGMGKTTFSHALAEVLGKTGISGIFFHLRNTGIQICVSATSKC